MVGGTSCIVYIFANRSLARTILRRETKQHAGNSLKEKTGHAQYFLKVFERANIAIFYAVGTESETSRNLMSQLFPNENGPNAKVREPIP